MADTEQPELYVHCFFQLPGAVWQSWQKSANGRKTSNQTACYEPPQLFNTKLILSAFFYEFALFYSNMFSACSMFNASRFLISNCAWALLAESFMLTKEGNKLNNKKIWDPRPLKMVAFNWNLIWSDVPLNPMHRTLTFSRICRSWKSTVNAQVKFYHCSCILFFSLNAHCNLESP